ncbi:MAG: acetoin utilization protein AcuC [Magnetococcales bacterium]|nr:acetoin utilization protein AcuC [Magnetococcales bacterium]
MSILPCVTIGDEIARYGFGGGHPFGPHRMAAFWQEMVSQGLDSQVRQLSPVKATQEELERFHTPEYIGLVRAKSKTGRGYLDGGDTPAVKGIYDSAAYVVGSTLDATDRIMSGECNRVFIPIAGLHHAQPESAGGFCVFNDAGVVIHTLREKYNIQRVAYIDIDAHHGDGVFYAFEDDPLLFFIDTHQDGRTIYPGSGHAHETGVDGAEGTKLNLPLPPHTGDSSFIQLLPKITDFLLTNKPDFILMQCGADSIAGDPITDMRLSPAAFYTVASRVVQIAEELGHGRVLATGGGGYNPNNIGTGWSSIVKAFIDNQQTGQVKSVNPGVGS